MAVNLVIVISLFRWIIRKMTKLVREMNHPLRILRLPLKYRRTYTSRAMSTHPAAGGFAFDFIGNSVKRTLSTMPKEIKAILSQVGHKGIRTVTIYRSPIQSFIRDLGSRFTNIDEAMEKLGIDKVYHLWIELGLDDGSILSIEKNERLMASLYHWERAGAQSMTVSYTPTRASTVNQLFTGLENRFGKEKVYYYSARTSNCQHFTTDVLSVLGLDTPCIKKFVLQDTRSLLTPAEGTVTDAVIDVAAIWNQIAHGGSVFKKKILY